MSIGLSKRRSLELIVIGAIFIALSIMVNATLNGINLNTPQSNENISGTYLLNATVVGTHANNITFYWSNDTGTNWHKIATVQNDTYPDTEFTYLWDTSTINDDTGLYINATAMNDTVVVSTSNSGITVDNTPPLIVPISPSGTISGTVEVSAVWSDETSGVETARYIWSNSTWSGNWISLNGTNDTTELEDGDYNITYNATDYLGNSNATYITVDVDNNPPRILINSPQNNSIVQNSSAFLNVSIIEANPDMLWWQLDSNGTNVTGCISCNIYETTISLSDGDHHIEVWSNDTLGRVNHNTTYFTVASALVTITVNDSSNNEPIQGAVVVLNNSDLSFTNTTDSLGEAELKLDSTKLYNLTVTKNGYITYTSLNQNFSTNQERNILLTGNSSLYGFVEEIGKGPIIANVEIYDNSTNDLKYQTTSDSSGFYTIPISGAFSYYVKFSVTGYIPKILGNYTGTRELNTSLYQQGFGSLTFKVLDYMNDRSVPNSNIIVSWDGESEHGITNASGITTIEVSAGAVYNASISCAGYLNNTLTGLSTSEATDKYYEIHLKGDSKIYGYVRDEENSHGVIASLELWNENNTEKLNWDSSYFYTTTSQNNGYYEIYYPSTLSNMTIYVHAKSAGYNNKNVSSGGSQYVDIGLRGSAIVTGKVVDKLNSSCVISGATVQILNSSTGDVLYEKATNSDGNFTIYVKDGINYVLKITKHGYNEYMDTTTYSTSRNYGQIEIEGNSLVKGKVIDYQNNTIVLSNVHVSLSSGNLYYSTYTNLQGIFELNVSPGTYVVSFEKTGYRSKETQITISTYNDIGDITLQGSSIINGTVTDPTRLQPGIELSGVKVKLKETGGSRVYSTTTDWYGFYQLYIPSDIMDYSITFNKNGFKKKTVNHPGNVTLVGATHVEGRVYDKYNNKNLDNVLVGFTDQYYNTYYETKTDSLGRYSINLGFDSNYLMAARKDGYQVKYVNLSEGMGFPYDAGDTGAWDRVQNIPMEGLTHIHLRTIDDFSGDPIQNSHVCVKYQTDECEYSEMTDNNGTVDFYVDGMNSYTILISSMGYPSQTLQTYWGIDQTVNLTAYARVHVYDQYAEDSFKNVPNANVILMYGSNTTSFNYTLEETNVTIRVLCNAKQRDGIKVTLGGVTKVTSGSDNVTFHHVPTGEYQVLLSGNDTGCGIATKDINITHGGIGYVFPESYYAYNLNKTVLIVKVINPIGEGLEGGTVTADSLTANETGSGIYNFTYIPGGTYQVQASVANYHANSSSYQVTPGAINNYTTTAIILKPYPGNLSVYVQNVTSNPLENIMVTVSNGSSQTIYTTNGWANFTDLISLYGVEVNGTLDGYSYNLTQNFFVEPNQTNYLYVTLNSTRVLITVKNQTSDNVEGANVTIWNGSQIATSANGTPLTELTDSNGQVSFSRVKLFNYNITINKTGYDQFSTSMRPDFTDSPTWEKTYYLNTTQLEVTVTDESGGPLENVHVSLWNSTLGYSDEGYTNLNGKYVFMVSTGRGEYTLKVNGSSIGYNWTEKNITLAGNTLNKETMVLKPNILNVTVKDTGGDLVGDGVLVELGSLSNTTSSGFAVLYRVPCGSQTISANGTLQGYGYNQTSVEIFPGYNAFEILLGVTRLTIHVVNGTGDSVGNANVSLLNMTTGVVEKNGKGEFMNGSTDSNGNITFSYVPIGSYNISVEKSPLSNSTVYALTTPLAGRNNSITIDPDYKTTTPSPTNSDDPPIIFTITNSTGSPIDGVNVSVINRTDGEIIDSGLTNASGQVVLNVDNNNVYNFMIDGEKVGYGKYTDYNVPIGFTNATEGSTDQNGEANIEINGRTNYYVRTDTPGYDGYNDVENGIVRNGTYDDDISSNPDVRSSIEIPLHGVTHLFGFVYDKNFVNPVELSYEPVQSLLQIYYSHDCMGDVRYKVDTFTNGSFDLYVTPYQVGSTTQMIYCIKTSSSGFEDGNYYNLQFSSGDENESLGMVGSGVISGYVREAVTEKPLSDVDIELRSSSCYGGYSNCDAYENTTNSLGEFYFRVNSNSNYQPFDAILNKTNLFWECNNLPFNTSW